MRCCCWSWSAAPARGRQGPEAVVHAPHAGGVEGPPLGVCERKDLGAARKSKMQRACSHLGRHVKARIDSGAAAPAARRVCIRGRGRGRGRNGVGDGERRGRGRGAVGAVAGAVSGDGPRAATGGGGSREHRASTSVSDGMTSSGGEGGRDGCRAASSPPVLLGLGPRGTTSTAAAAAMLGGIAPTAPPLQLKQGWSLGGRDASSDASTSYGMTFKPWKTCSSPPAKAESCPATPVVKTFATFSLLGEVVHFVLQASCLFPDTLRPPRGSRVASGVPPPLGVPATSSPPPLASPPVGRGGPRVPPPPPNHQTIPPCPNLRRPLSSTADVPQRLPDLHHRVPDLRRTGTRVAA
jgi:hypothetical protein